jgi:hypothetical protein
MRQLRSSLGCVFGGAAACTAWLALCGPLCAESVIITPAQGYQANDRLANIDLTGLDVQGDLMTSYVDKHLKVYDRNTWQPLYDLGDAGYAGDTATYLSFAKFDPSGNSIWVGYTVGGNSNDRIFQVTNFRTTPVWNYRTTLASNFDLAFRGTTPYVSGPDSDVYGADNKIWRLDSSGPTLIATLDGFAAGIAFDAAGSLYYGTNLGANNRLVRFSAAQVTEGNKAMTDAETLTAMPLPGTGVTVDDAGHVLFTVHESDEYWYPVKSTLGIWNGTSGVGDHYQVIGDAGSGHAYTDVRAIGDVTAGGTIYLNDAGAWNTPVLGLAEITRVPEPSAFALMIAGVLAALAWRRRKE